jgi:hypothetical protein
MAENDPTVDDITVTDPGDTGGGDEKDYKADAEKWKTLSRKHEAREKELLKELDALKTASMSDAEKAIKEAETRGESKALKSVTNRLVKAELKAVAATKGAVLPDLDVLDLSKFATEDGDPDDDAIERFVSSLGTTGKRFADSKDLGIGRQGDPSKPRQWTRQDLQGKTPEEVVEARKAGHLDQLLGR